MKDRIRCLQALALFLSHCEGTWDACRCSGWLITPRDRGHAMEGPGFIDCEGGVLYPEVLDGGLFAIELWPAALEFDAPGTEAKVFFEESVVLFGPLALELFDVVPVDLHLGMAHDDAGATGFGDPDFDGRYSEDGADAPFDELLEAHEFHVSVGTDERERFKILAVQKCYALGIELVVFFHVVDQAIQVILAYVADTYEAPGVLGSDEGLQVVFHRFHLGCEKYDC